MDSLVVTIVVAISGCVVYNLDISKPYTLFIPVVLWLLVMIYMVVRGY